MSRRQRTVAYGSALAIAVGGGVVAAIVGGEAGQLLAIGLLSIGLGAVVLLVFFEIGLSEDRDRIQEQERRERKERDEQRRAEQREHAHERESRPQRLSWRRPRRPS